MAAFQDFLKFIRPAVPQCPESAIIEAVRAAAIRFCTDTWLIRESLAGEDVTAGYDDYKFVASSDKEPIGTIALIYDSRYLNKQTEEELDRQDSTWRTGVVGEPSSFVQLEPDRIKLDRVPESSIIGGMTARIATRPTDDSLSCDDQLFNDWREAIKYGALANLAEVQNRAWSDIKMALYYERKFIFQIQRGKSRAVMGNSNKSPSVKMRAWI